ncbi:lectin [Brevibacillus dissolubilis]|uniref:lectin n=1 Tax=Brevibacillus dissolubilis TaxID=1844116 RepID=UPI001115EC91|nr:lectin [Brevibacillus dissolubilis]
MKKLLSLLIIPFFLFAFSSSSFAAANENILRPGEFLWKYDALVSNNGKYALFIANGDLVLVSIDGRTLWHTGTAGTSTSGLYMTPDGDCQLIWFDTYLFHTNTAGHPGAFLVVQDDGNLVVYTPEGVPLWNSGTWE